MTHGGMLWGAALYNNGSYPLKNTRFGESYSHDGTPQDVHTLPPPTPEETRTKGIVPELTPLERWEISQPGNVLRVFERGGEKKARSAIPTAKKSPGAPDDKLGDRGFGTQLRTDPVFLGLQKTRLLDPLLSLPGTNDQPGDYRGSGCTACHVVYANDRSPEHSGPVRAVRQSRLQRVTRIRRSRRTNRAIRSAHTFTRSIPSSQCMVCHVHPGTNMVTTYFGYTWWDNEADGESMYPAEAAQSQRRRTVTKSQQRNPEGAAARGCGRIRISWNSRQPEFNSKLKHTQFADFHGHGWVFRAVFKRDRQGNLLDADGNMVAADDPGQFAKAVHLEDIHLEKGMHCVDCHFEQDAHGNGKLYGEPRAAIELDCTDCHGTIAQRATLRTSGPAAPDGGTHLEALRTPWGERALRMARRQALPALRWSSRDKEWEVVQTLDTITPGNPHYSEKSRAGQDDAHRRPHLGRRARRRRSSRIANSSMTCYACHTSWTPNCFGCHLAMPANERKPMLHNEGLTTRNYTVVQLPGAAR